MTLRRGITVLLLALAIVLLVPAARASGDLKYIEVVREKTDCGDGACFIEYLFLSNGLAIKKQFYSTDYEKIPVMSIRKASEPQVAALMEKAARMFTEKKDFGNTARDQNNLFLYDGNYLSTYSALAKPSAEFMSVFDMADAAFAGSAVAPDFYLHQYYALPSKQMEDFHLFSDGSAIFSTFQLPEYKLVATQTLRYSEEEMSAVREQMKAALKASGQKLKYCPADTGLTYGFVEMQSNGYYLRSYTCANEGDAIAGLFSHIRNLKPQD
jgi:hypothetical protein